MALTPSAVALLLVLLEQREPLLSGAAAEFQAEETAVLDAAGLLVSDGHDDVATVAGDQDDVPVSLFWSERLGGLAAFSATSGPVLIPPERLHRRRVCVRATLSRITAALDLPENVQLSEQIAGLAWELGEVRLGRQQQKNSLWFIRRLSDRVVQHQLAAALAARPHPRLRVLLTSSRGERLDGFHVPGTSIVPLRDVLVRPDDLAVCGDILAARISGVAVPQTGGPIDLSEDGTTLVINGVEQMVFKSARHIKAIRALVEAYRSGRRLRAVELTPGGNLSTLFGGVRWKELTPYLKSRDGRWGFEP